MKQFEQTTLSKLKKGDRFYFISNKKPLQFIESKSEGYDNIYIYSDNDKIKETRMNKKVVFLRNIETK